MAEGTRQLVVRLPVSLVERIEAHVERLKREAPWSNPNKAMAVRMLLADALDRAEQAAKQPQKPARG